MFRKCRVQESGSLTGIEQQISPKEPNLIATDDALVWYLLTY